MLLLAVTGSWWRVRRRPVSKRCWLSRGRRSCQREISIAVTTALHRWSWRGWDSNDILVHLWLVTAVGDSRERWAAEETSWSGDWSERALWRDLSQIRQRSRTSKLHLLPTPSLPLCSYSLQLDEAQSNVTRFREQVFQLQSQLDQQKISHEQQMLVTTQAHSFPYNATVPLFAVSWLKTLVLNCEDVLILQWRREKPLCSKHRSCLTS